MATTPTTTIRVAETTRRRLHALARQDGLSMQEVIEAALELYRRKRIFEQANAAYAELHANTAASAEWERELSEWDATLADGLEGY
jgi:hypothetical protein